MSQKAAVSAQAMVADAKARVENLSPDQVSDELARGDAVLVDLRDSDERHQNGVLAGAVHVPRGMLEFRADPLSPYHNEALQPSKRIILHCASGGRSALGARTLSAMGYQNVAHLDGGLKAWKEQGKPVEQLTDRG